MVLESFFNTVGRFTLALQVVGVVCLWSLVRMDTDRHSIAYLSRPAPVVTAWLSLKVGSLLIVESPTKAIGDTGWLVGGSFDGTMLRNGIDDVLPRRSPQCLRVRLTDCSNGGIFDMLVIARNAGSIIWSFVVITCESGVVETIDDICAGKVLLPKMRSTVSNLLVITNDIKWPVGSISRVALS